MDHIDLFPLLYNRLNQENQSMPEYIGEFNGVGSLPKGEYPAIYYWVDRENHNSVRLSFNTPKLETWCVEEALANGLNVDVIESSVQKALATLQQVSSSAFEAMMNEMLNSEPGSSTVKNSIETTPSKPKKWWQFW
ncbi:MULTISPECIES: hypothetical protein [Pseudoalteromonas]|uniref:hypothetical protein n=1 Tax=Pseudoalteromonas TaxID=53246 RepID=UPI00057DAA6C|nr:MULTISPECIES: hypothetical protein [Pseudoalteromonas]KID35262.1 hypothetical protein QT15_13455 [Pseudoalteromonas flavipulchra NCIMB 2033 = ATCC BAA-314]MBD0780513.1 hypothetical protein [Pseudoalteromonas flavipulchra]MBE0375299.1 hypothetical protein [Pseudoalteromonas flavipulchra NCIMB 2033 = ATCC BAA-314]QZO15650.1 hypothetical protein K5642_20615 [Pseudoalteromonas piscicida]WMO16403.1 hypothetical protein NI376_19355 [Pseudoalteromonas piscicida]